MEANYFRDTGGYLYHIKLRTTADAHSRRVLVDGQEVGLLLFHDWQFLFETTTPRFNLRIMPRLLQAINEDSTIAFQKREDDRVIMARNARSALAVAGADHSKMTDQEAVMAYMNRMTGDVDHGQRVCLDVSGSVRT
jgi:hypothetical protein